MFSLPKVLKSRAILKGGSRVFKGKDCCIIQEMSCNPRGLNMLQEIRKKKFAVVLALSTQAIRDSHLTSNV